MASAAQILRQYRENKEKERRARSNAPTSAIDILRKWREEQEAKSAPALSHAASLYAKKKEDDEEKNKGGLLGGLGYLGHKIGLGFIQGVEGILDYAVGGIADLFGADDWAERQFKSDWLNYNHADEWYNPGEGWKFAGDVAGGIGTSLPGIGTSVGLTLATGGTALPAFAGIGVGSLSAAGTSTKEAMQESGELTGKEYLYGAGMGAVEAVTEKLSGGIGAGVTKAAKSVGKVVGKVAAKETAESAAKKGVSLSLKTAAKSAAKEFAGEAFEEGFSEWVAPYIARATYDPNAQNASAQEIFYSALVGGLAGVGMGGATGALTQGINYYSGKSIVNNGRTQQIMNLAKTYTEEDASKTEAAASIRELYGKLASVVESGASLNAEQERMLGELAAFETQEQLRPMVQRSAISAIQSADVVAERLNAMGRYKMVDGKLTDTQRAEIIREGAEVREITAEDIRGTFDPSDKKSLAKEIKTNDVLRLVASMDAAGRLMLTAQDVEKTVLTGTRIQTQAELNEFITSASAEQKAAVGKELGIEDWNTLTVEEFAKKASAYRESGKAEAYKKKSAKVKEMQGLAESKARNIPRAIALADGAVQRYADADSNFAVARDGDTFIVYDYDTGNVTRDMTRAEVNAALAKYRESKSATSKNFSSDAEIEIKDEKISKTAFENEFSEEKSRPTVKEIKAANEAKAQAAAIESLAKEKIKDYADLTKPNQSMVRKVLREAMSSGISEADALSYARVAARSGLDITFDKEACYKGKNEAGEETYAAGYYDPDNNRIVVNPEAKKKHASLLIHELSHAIRSYVGADGKRHYKAGIDDVTKISDEMWEKINAYYGDGTISETQTELRIDEASAYYAEQMLGTDAAIDLLLGEKPTLKQKILSFFKKSARDYSSDEALSRESRKFLREYKALFDRFSERNRGRNIEAGNASDEKNIREAMEDESYESPITIADISKLRAIGRKSVNNFTEQDIEVSKKWAYKFYKELGVKSPFFRAWFGDWREKQKKTRVEIADIPQYVATNEARNKNRGIVKNSDTEWEIRVSREGETNTISHSGEQRLSEYGLSGVRGLIESSIYLDSEVHEHHGNNAKNDYISFDHKLYALGKSESGDIGLYKITVEEFFQSKSEPGNKRFHNLRYIEKIADNVGGRTSEKSRSGGSTNDISANYSISDLYEFVKTYDKDFVTAPTVNEVLLNADGTPKVFYHGTGARFTEFNPDEMSSVEGSYFFAENREDAQAYGKNIYEVYLSGRNLADYDNQPSEFYRLKNKREQVQWLKERGYDGWYADMDSDGWGELSVFSPEQIKSATDNVGTFSKTKKDIRYSMDEEPSLPRTSGTMSVGQYKKRVADLTKSKSYTKDQIYDILKKIPMADMASAKTREQIAEAVWQIFNEDLTAGERQNAAHDISEFLVSKLMTEAKVDNPTAQEANETIAYLRTGIGKLAFSTEDRAEILHNVDKDGWRRILGRWGFKGKRNADGALQGVRTPMEVFVTDVAREMPGMEYLEEMHPVEAFLEIDAYYSRVKEEAANKKTSAFLSMSDEDIEGFAKSIEESILDAYQQGGKKSIFIKRIEQGVSYYEQRASRYKQDFDEIKGRDKINGLLMNQAQKMKDLKLGRFANVTEGANETFKKTIFTLANMQYRGNLSVTNAKKAIKDLYVWYTSKEVKENLFGFTDKDPGLWQQGVAEMMEELAANESKGFSKVELYALLDVLTYFTHFVENFGKVWHHGEWVDAKELATGFIEVAQNQSPVKHKLVRNLARTYMQNFGDPAAVVRMMDQYQDGFFTQIFDDLREASISARYAETEILSDYNEFLEKNKRYVEKASNDTVQYRGVDIPKMHLISLYMTLKRKHAHAGYAINGFQFKKADGETVRIRGSLDPDAVYSAQEIEAYIDVEKSKIEKLLSDADKQYISILEKVYNVDAKRLKADRDIQRFGMTNATSDYYYPLRRANTAKKMDSDISYEIDRVSSASFNKDTVKGAKQELFIESANALFLRHVHVVCQYAYLTPVLDMQKMLYNTDISGNPNHPVSIATESQNIWPEGFKYFQELVSDVQGIPRSTSTGMKFLSTLRGNYAKFQLGANPKTWVTQLSSLFAATGILDASSILNGLGMSSAGFDQYSKLAKIRIEDNAAAMAQGVLDNKAKRATDAIGDALMAPIGMMDKFVVGKLYCACQVQIENDGGAKIGSEENKIEAGKLLTRVILETQQNSLSTERSAAMRSGNEFYRALTMFRSDSMKVIGRVIDGFGEIGAIKRLLKNNTMDADSRKELEARLGRAKKKTAKASAALVLSAVFMALIAQGFRWLYAKEKDEDETFAETLVVDALGNMLGGLPGIADAYTKLVEGYDVGNYSYSAINDVLDSAKGLFDIADGIITGEGTAQERMRAIRSASYSLGQILGLPTRNVYNVLYGLTKRVSKKAGYAIDNWFYEKNYKADLYKAIEDGNDSMTTYIMGLLLGERLDQSMSDAVFSEILALSKSGYKVLPKTVPNTVSVNGEEYELTDEEQEALRAEYSTYTEGLSRLIARKEYAAMTDEQKESAIDYVSDLYYDRALKNALGVDRENKDLLLLDILGAEKLAIYRLSIKGLSSDKDKDGKTVSGSKRKKVIAAINQMSVTREEKLLLIATSGYSLQDGDVRGMSAEAAKNLLLRYILSMKISKDEKAAIAEACGFTVKNGKILKNSA